MALGRLANYSDDLAETLVQNEVLPQLVYSLSEQNRFYKKAATFCLRAVAKHSPQLAQVSSGAPPIPQTNMTKQTYANPAIVADADVCLATVYHSI